MLAKQLADSPPKCRFGVKRLAASERLNRRMAMAVDAKKRSSEVMIKGVDLDKMY